MNAEPINNFWTLTFENYCSSFLSATASGGGLIHSASSKARVAAKRMWGLNVGFYRAIEPCGGKVEVEAIMPSREFLHS